VSAADDEIEGLKRNREARDERTDSAERR